MKRESAGALCGVYLEFMLYRYCGDFAKFVYELLGVSLANNIEESKSLLIKWNNKYIIN